MEKIGLKRGNYGWKRQLEKWAGGGLEIREPRKRRQKGGRGSNTVRSGEGEEPDPRQGDQRSRFKGVRVTCVGGGVDKVPEPRRCVYFLSERV